ncbi:dipeptidyl aminopeptidase/acylaminoacyl peptidase [Bacillus mesophilus]|uniref:Alpha/beta hydrolase n=1 Tax=Bacillus mesophilus TaxID=1808955 RepID=A0A6M0Q6U0_9BACI|nr:alpha/beta hydrolase [Bacillus mesophilus]MBM7661398.1 dipeptidyl aminopeptidase/acylaminoacyl peptidase [Bacillus mesophilus]NEY72071.1 alpha/beta hydrolase [Bacillus mesophilus]
MRVLIVIKPQQFKQLLLNTVLLLLFFIIAITGASVYVGYKVMSPIKLAIINLPTAYELEYEDVTFSNRYDDVQLKGWWIPSSRKDYITQKAVIFSHSYGDNRERMPIETLKLAKRLSMEGFHVFMYDFRNSGESGGLRTTIGMKEKTDLLSAIHYVKHEKDIHEIGLLGWSMGASTSIIVGSESDDIKAVIADSPFADLETYTKQSFTYWTGLPSQVGEYMVNIAENVFIDLNLSGIKPYVAARLYENKGLMLIHSTKDGAISYKQSELIFSNAPNAEIWITKKGGHIRNYKHQKEKYEERVIEFLNKYLQNDQVVFNRI